MFPILSGFLFLFIIVDLILATEKYGYEVFSELDADKKLQEINDDPEGFRTGTALVLVEHGAIVALAIALFIAFSSYDTFHHSIPCPLASDKYDTVIGVTDKAQSALFKLFVQFI